MNIPKTHNILEISNINIPCTFNYEYRVFSDIIRPLSDMNRCFFHGLLRFSSWSLTPGRSLINPIAFNEQLINIHIPWQIFDDVLLTSAYVIGLSSSLAIKYWWVCNTADCCCQKCNSVAMTFYVAVTGRQIRRFTVQTLTLVPITNTTPPKKKICSESTERWEGIFQVFLIRITWHWLAFSFSDGKGNGSCMIDLSQAR